MIFNNRDFSKPFWDKIQFNPIDWNMMIDLLDSHPEKEYHRVNEKFRISLNSFHRRQSAPNFAKQIVKEMESVFHKNQITNIAFFGVGRNTHSYPLHKDTMDVFLVQVLGEIDLQVDEEERLFIPGDCVYIPRGTQHKIMPKASRVTFSFGVEGIENPVDYLTL